VVRDLIAAVAGAARRVRSVSRPVPPTLRSLPVRSREALRHAPKGSVSVATQETPVVRYADRSSSAGGPLVDGHDDGSRPVAPGKRTLVEQIDPVARRSGSGGSQVVQRKENPDDAKLLEHQASLQGPDVEIPALEGALLATRVEAVKRGLLSRASFDAGLALSRAMTQLQPTVAAKGTADRDVQEQAAGAAQQLLAALQHETADDRNFKDVPSMVPSGGGITTQNPTPRRPASPHRCCSGRPAMTSGAGSSSSLG
jgi:hypothetical protein